MADVARGKLFHPADAPALGERFVGLAQMHTTSIEQILSSAAPEADDAIQDHDEWVVVLTGAATLEVEGDACDLGVGDWILLPAGTRHRVVDTEAGTSWLAVHVQVPSPG